MDSNDLLHIYLYALPKSGGPLRESISALVADKNFLAMMDAVSDWPEHSTIGRAEKAMLLWLARDSNSALEIGTYWAGTTYLLAWAMDNVHTIDPYGAARVPGLLKNWPVKLSRKVQFSAVNSSEYLWGGRIPRFDLVFIDGSHTYANCFHDICASIVACSEQAYLVIDNTEQPDVIDAVRDFSKLNPHVEIVLVRDGGSGVVVGGVDLDYTNFAVLRVDKTVIAPGKTYTYHVNGLKNLSLGELEFRAQGRGTVSFDIHLRALPSDQNKESVMYDLPEIVDLDLNARFVSSLSLPESAIKHNKFCEISMRLLADAAIRDCRLLLNGHPIHIGLNYL